MKFAVLYSKKDEAGVTIVEQLKKIYLPQMQIIELKKDSIYSEDIDKEEQEKLKTIDFIIFASKHKSEKKDLSLSLHAPGNWRNADFGGKQGKICKTSALALKFLFKKLNENNNLEKYKTTLECTHHGPLIEKPCCFIELGSSEEQWKDKQAAEIIAKTISDFQNFNDWKENNKKQIKVAIAIGGPHYCPNFNKIQLNSEYAISHILPEYQLPVNESMLLEAIQKTYEHVDLAILDWKGCGKSEERQKIIQLLEKLGIDYERTERIKK